MESPTIAGLRAAYAAGRALPRTVIGRVAERAAGDRHGVWIHRLGRGALDAHLARIEKQDARQAALWGVPFAIKDNVDLADTPTTAGCPGFAYTPVRSATVVERLLAAGAVPVGKTNMDQFATGLVGVRSPYGATCNAVAPEYIAGGSSSGSAVAVKLGMAAFAIGTDTAGSGRVPAAFNGLVGFKPSRGWWSTRGVVPACRTLDCVSVFTRNVADARTVADIAGGFDEEDTYARRVEFSDFDALNARFAFADPASLSFLGNEAYRALYRDFVAGLPNARTIDVAPFLAAGKLLYDGPWLAERQAAVGDFIESNPTSVLPVTRSVIQAGRRPSATACFEAQYRLAELKRQADMVFVKSDVLVLPTAPTIYRHAEVERDPVGTNASLGEYTNFVNLLDLCAVAIPAGHTPDGLPFGITLMAPAGYDYEAIPAGHTPDGLPFGITPGKSGHTPDGLPFGITLMAPAGYDYALLNAAAALRGEPIVACPDQLRIAVCGAHMAGQPLNGDLVRRGAYLVSQTRTASNYRLYALPDGKRPALVRTDGEGAAIEVEVWSLPAREAGGFLATIAPPLGLGSVELRDGQWVNGFIAEGRAVAGAVDVTVFGGWRSYRSSRG